jgi:two-component system CheB/CheR fusion protein
MTVRMKRILIVEDSDDILFILQMELEGAGYSVAAAHDAAAGLELARLMRPDVIVSDLKMPTVDGFEFIRRIRQIPGLADIPAIALTGFSSQKEIKNALAAGFTAHATKPMEISDLVKVIEQLTAKRLKRVAG